MKSNNYPPHPAVNWDSIVIKDQARYVCVTCPYCGKERVVKVSQVVYSIKIESFTGSCYAHRGQGQSDNATKNAPIHPLVDWSNKIYQKYGGIIQAMVSVTCPRCRKSRYSHAYRTHKELKWGDFTGICRRCTRTSPLTEQGYVKISPYDLSEEDRKLFKAMQKKGHVAEHRMVMAKMLNRPLESYELVDHMDGNKQNNSPDNLRLYVRGKNHPGSHNGHGTYYHEWQMALIEIHKLKEKLEIAN